MDQETLRTLAMQRVQQLILSPESRSLTVYPVPGLQPSININSPPTPIPQPWLQSNSASDSGNISFASRSDIIFQFILFFYHRK